MSPIARRFGLIHLTTTNAWSVSRALARYDRTVVTGIGLGFKSSHGLHTVCFCTRATPTTTQRKPESCREPVDHRKRVGYRATTVTRVRSSYVFADDRHQLSLNHRHNIEFHPNTVRSPYVARDGPLHRALARTNRVSSVQPTGNLTVTGVYYCGRLAANQHRKSPPTSTR